MERLIRPYVHIFALFYFSFFCLKALASDPFWLYLTIIKKHIKTHIMKKDTFKYGIQIVKPWSREMYNHNDEVLEAAKEAILDKWQSVYDEAEQEWSDEDEDDYRMPFADAEWIYAKTDELEEVQTAITCYRFSTGYDVLEVANRSLQELEDAAYWRVKEIAEDLEIELEKEFIGFN